MTTIGKAPILAGLSDEYCLWMAREISANFVLGWISENLGKQFYCLPVNLQVGDEIVVIEGRSGIHITAIDDTDGAVTWSDGFTGVPVGPLYVWRFAK